MKYKKALELKVKSDSTMTKSDIYLFELLLGVATPVVLLLFVPFGLFTSVLYYLFIFKPLEKKYVIENLRSKVKPLRTFVNGLTAGVLVTAFSVYTYLNAAYLVETAHKDGRELSATPDDVRGAAIVLFILLNACVLLFVHRSLRRL